MDDKKTQSQPAPINIGVDPLRTPILYADAIRITSNENGFVLDILQGIAGTNQAVVVARIGLSKEHTKKLAEKLAEQIIKQGEFITRDVKVVH